MAQRRGRTRKHGLGRLETKLSELLENMRWIDRHGPSLQMGFIDTDIQSP